MDEYPGNWLTSPAESTTSDRIIFITGRTDVEKFRANPRFNIRVEVTFTYESDERGFPKGLEVQILGEVSDKLVETFRKDPVAVLTGIYTGDGIRTWVFYTASTNIFQKKFNEALTGMPTLPIIMQAFNDPDWEEYSEMREAL